MPDIHLRNPVTGDAIVLHDPLPKRPDDTLAFTTRLAPHAKGSPPHRHVRVRETFVVIEGEVNFRLGRTERILSAGDSVTVDPGTVHGFRNATPLPSVLACTVAPGTDFAAFLRGMQAAAERGIVNASGLPRDPRHLARLLLLADFHFPLIPARLQRGLFLALAALAPSHTSAKGQSK